MKKKHWLILLGFTFIQVQCTPANQPVATETVHLPPTATSTTESTTLEEVIPELPLEMEVPQGPAPAIDGTFSEGEWAGALVSELSDGSELRMLHDGGYLYLGIRSQRMGVGSVCTKRGNQVWILHASAALGNAIYENTDEGWQMIEGFEWCCRSTTPNDEQMALLEENHWTASIGYMGEPTEMEYQIAMEEDAITLAMAYYLSRSSIPFWPGSLEDDCRLYDVVEGSPPDNVQFDTDTWVTLTAGGSAVSPALGDMMTRQRDEMTMVYVPGGTFMMGSTQAQIDIAHSLCEQYPDAWGKCAQSGEAFETESPQHEVSLDGFWIDRTEITRRQYALCVEEGVCRQIGVGENPDDLPVAGIPWEDAVSYCAWAGGRLPTEAEWEYAARGPSGSIFPWGDEFACQYGNFFDDITKCSDGYPKASPVGSFPEGISWSGALDMAGNMWEWVADGFREYSSEDQDNPTNPPADDEGILRGGSWGYGPGHIRTTYRYMVPLSANYQAVGFRCVISEGKE